MNRYRVTLAMIGMAMFVVCGQWFSQAAAQVNIDVGGVHVHVGDRQPPPPEQVEVLTRGPLHEAFAQPVILDEGAPFMITRQPPAPLNEIVPEDKPQGSNVLWIPGYWSWDGDRNDFIWVSGCWRVVPPNNSWVPGYWAQVQGGYQWIAGFWTAANTQELEYLPAPPATLEEGPQGAGSPDNIWIPGCWVRQDGRYAWRPGFWEPGRSGWFWEPAHYVFTPRGYVYVDGYWDYPVHHRGVAFAPVYCPPGLYGQAGFGYCPDIALDLDGMLLNLFISPQRHQYYFGDYYDSQYSQEGFYPWYESRDHHDWYDPIFVHQQWNHRADKGWYETRRSGYDQRRDDKSLRPARTYEAMQAQVARLPENQRQQAQMVRPMKEAVSAKNAPFKYDTLDAKTREATASQAKDVHAYKDQRAQWERPSAAPKTGLQPKEGTAPREVLAPKEPAPSPSKELSKEPAKEVAPLEKPQTPERGAVAKEQPVRQDVQPQKVTIPKSPVTAREPVTDKESAPPPRPKHPEPDLNAKPKPSKADTPERSK